MGIAVVAAGFLGVEVEDDFFGGDERRTLAGEKTADAIRARFGADAVTSARALKGKSSAQD